MAQILLIEDEQAVRAVVKRMLETAGHQVAVAVDGDDGLRQFHESPPDLVLCDVFMPNMEGIATLKELRQISSDLPVIVMSGGAPSSGRVGEAYVDYLSMARSFGATATIQKPFTMRQLRSIVDGILRR